MDFETILLAITTISLGLSTGFFYTWTFSVVGGIGRLDDRCYLLAMQAMNRAILNPGFFLVFLGSILMLPVTLWCYYQPPLGCQFWYITAAAAVYFPGTILLTFLGNVPMNNQLDRFDIEAAKGEERREMRNFFERRWNRFNVVRTITSTTAFIMMVLACLQGSF